MYPAVCVTMVLVCFYDLVFSFDLFIWNYSESNHCLFLIARLTCLRLRRQKLFATFYLFSERSFLFEPGSSIYFPLNLWFSSSLNSSLTKTQTSHSNLCQILLRNQPYLHLQNQSFKIYCCFFTSCVLISFTFASFVSFMIVIYVSYASI